MIWATNDSPFNQNQFKIFYKKASNKNIPRRNITYNLNMYQ